MADGRRGHVDRARTYGPGSVLARIADEQRQLQQEAEEEFDAAEEELQQAQITWPELWDARTTAGFVGLQLQQDDTSKSLQCWWGFSNAQKREQSHQSRSARLLQYSGVLARVVQRSAGTWPADVAAQEPTRAGPATVTQQAHQLFDPAPKRRRVELAVQHQGVSDVLRRAPNGATAVNREMWGAARWDGPDGQLQQRIIAALQTADQSVTTYKQVAARVLAESGSHHGAGLVPSAGVQAEVKALGARRVAEAAAAGAGAPAGVRQMPRGSKPQSGLSVAGGQGVGGAAVDGELQLLDDHGCLPAAHGVYHSLVTCLQQLQPQQQQQQQPSAEHDRRTECDRLRLQSASAGAAAFAPGLLASVLQQQSGAPAIKLDRLSVSSWVVDCFEASAAAACAAHAQRPYHQQQQGSALPGQRCAALRRPLPLPTVLELCDRQGAAVRQAIADAAADLVAACAGRLPVITCSYVLDGFELLCEEIAPQVWLWACWDDDTEQTLRLPAHSGRGRHEGDLRVLQSITCPNWEELRLARIRVHAWLEAWRRSLVHQQGGDAESYLKYYKAGYRMGDSRDKSPTTVFPQPEWDSQMRKLLQRQVARVSTAWGAAPMLGLQQGLSQHQPQQQVGQQGAGPAVAAGVRCRARLRRQVVDIAALDEQLKGIIGCSDSGGSDSSGAEFSGAEHDSGLSSDGHEIDDCIHDTGDRRRRRGGLGPNHSGTGRRRGAFERQQQEMLEEVCADHEAWLGSLDDLMLPQGMTAAPAAAAAREAGTSRQAVQGVAQPAPGAWRPAANSQWRAVAAAEQVAGAQRPGGMRAGGRSQGTATAVAHKGAAMSAVVEGWPDVPAGAQLLLGQAARAGVAPHVLQRTALRLNMMLKAAGSVTAN